VYIVSLVVLDRYEHRGQFATVDVFPPYLLGPLEAKLLIGSKKSWTGWKMAWVPYSQSCSDQGEIWCGKLGR